MAELSYNHFPQITAALHREIVAAIDGTADDVVTNIKDQIQANGQVDTGDMLNGIAKEDGPDEMSKSITSAMYYWIFQNYGTRFLPARPFVEPGVERTRPQFEARMAAIEAKIQV